MNPAEHYQRAEQLAKEAHVQHLRGQDDTAGHALAAIAQVHATLAALPVDPREVADLRGKVLVLQDALDRAREAATYRANQVAELAKVADELDPRELWERIESILYEPGAGPLARHRAHGPADSLHGRCTVCGLTWEQEAEELRAVIPLYEQAPTVPTDDTTGEGR